MAERILLHICCAPCATTVVRRLKEAGYDVHGFFYNPNIQPEKEYYQRLLEAQRLCKLWSIPLEIGDYDWDRWQAEVRGLEGAKEGGERCRVCYRFRLAATAEKAKELDIGIIATTLTISPHKRPDVVNPIGKEVCAELEIKFHEADWKKQDGFKQSLDTSRELHIYRQDYCGCKYSLKESEARRTESETRKGTALVQAAATAPSAGPSARVTRAMEILAGKGESKEAAPAGRAEDTRAKWELTPLERKLRRDKKAKPWQKP
jgi:predicted adenine nucleotide alpha hydrolase (AANH) superfamily ATPase